MGSFSIWHWLIVLVIVLAVFGTKKLRNIGSDLGGAVKGFKDAMNEGQQAPRVEQKADQKQDGNVIEGEVKHKDTSHS